MEEMMVNVGLKTYNEKKENIERKWYLVDAKDKILGKLAVEIAIMLRGKNKPTFTPSVDCGDFIVVINAEKIKVTGAKLSDKKYYSHSGYVGNLKVKNLEEMLQKHPERVIQKAVKGMIPHNKLGRKIIKKLKVYAGSKHPHEAQNPEKIDI
jgi:large subunit ribosomal protein L13